jgi:flagellar basal-body rod protein FlgB
MDLSSLKLFSMLGKHMSWLGARQEVLAQNIANSDTPSFVPHDLKPQGFGRMLRPSAPPPEMRMTDANHIEPLRRPPKIRDEKDRKLFEATPDGNAVVLEDQLMKVNETQAGFRLATNLYSKHVAMIKAALGRDRG